MHIDIDEVLIALKRDELRLSIGGKSIAFSPWIDWLVWLGQWMRIQADLDGRRVTVVRMPSRRLAAAFTAIGSVFASARLHDDSLDWEALRSLVPGTKVFWRDSSQGKSVRRAGTVVGVCQIGGSDVLEVEIEGQKKAHQGKRYFAKSAALSYGITLGLVSALADERLAGAEGAIRAALRDARHGWIRSPGIECCIITERTSFLSDLWGLDILTGGAAQASCIDILAIAEPGGKSHGKTRVASPRSDGVLDEAATITILDGAASLRRISDSNARSLVVLLDQAEYDEEVEQLLQTYLGYAIDAGVHQPAKGFIAPPTSVECFIFGLPLQPQSSL